MNQRWYPLTNISIASINRTNQSDESEIGKTLLNMIYRPMCEGTLYNVLVLHFGKPLFESPIMDHVDIFIDTIE